MGSDKNLWQESSRWLRIGALSISALSPFINILLARLRANVEAEEAVLELEKADLDELKQSAQHATTLVWQERLQALGTTLNELLVEMQESPYGQKLQEQGANLREQGNRFSQAVSERSGQLAQELAERGSDLRERSNRLSQVVAERSSQLTHDLAEQSSRLTQDLAERRSDFSQGLAQQSRRARRELAARDRNFWILLGFGTGLVATAIITYLFIRRRLQQAAEAEPPIQLSYSDTEIITENSGAPRGNIYSIGENGTRLEAQAPAPITNLADVANSQLETDLPTPPADETLASVDGSAETSAVDEAPDSLSPSDAVFVGVSSTKQYYPVETPLDQLHTADGEAVDVVYFSSEDEAQRQGFSAAIR